MSGVAKTVGKIAGVVATVAAVIPGGQGIAAIAAAVALTANMGAQVLASKPPAQGSVTRTTIGTDQPSCEMLGRTYSPGARVQLAGYGSTYKDVKNPYLLAVDVVSVGGPLDALETCLADFVPISFSGAAAGGYFGGFLWRSAQLGAQREASALPLHFAGAPGWGSDARLSGKAAIAWNALFDRDGRVFAGGFAQMGSIWRGVRAYDPRKDSTYPGGSGPQRWADPGDRAAFDAARATWTYTTSPGLLALRNALGSWERDETDPASVYRKVFGIGMPLDGLIVGDFVELANVCQANGWQCGGRVFEPSNRWDNLKRILASGGAEPAWRGGRLGLRIQAPRVALDTITTSDLADDGDIVVGGMQAWEQRLNTLVPKYRSEQHKWEFVATGQVQIGTYLAEDGEEKLEERQIDLVQVATQARQLCAYELLDRRELGEIEIPCKPRLRRYGPGDLLIVDIPEAGLVAQPAVVLRRSLNPVTMGVTLTLRGETIAKHAFALGLTGSPPATPGLRSTEEIDATLTSTAKGDKGDTGLPGPAGANGQTTFVHFAYADAPDGSVNFTTGAPGDRFYVGVYVDFTPTDSGNASDYQWSLQRGANGANGTPGPPGANGQPSYIHIAYANSADGSANFHVSDPTGRNYIGVYSDQTLADSGNPAAYTWSLIKGADGAPGLQGPQGVPGTNGTNGTNGANGAPGANGQTTYVHFAYADSADGSANFTTGAAEGRFYVGVYTDFSEPDSGNPASYTWSLQRGSNGANGIQGPPGANGQPTYVHTAYANSANGAVDFSVDQSANRAYLGVLVDFVVADSGNYADYTWSLIKGADGKSALVAGPSQASVALTGDVNGNPVEGELPRSVSNGATVSGVPVAIDSITSVVTNSCSVTVVGSSIRIDSVSATTASVKYKINASGQVADASISISVSKAPPPPATNNSVSMQIGTISVSNTSSQQRGPIVVLNSGASSSVSGSVGFDFRVDDPGDGSVGGVSLYAQVRYRIAGQTTWSPLSDEYQGFANRGVDEPTPGEIYADFGPVSVTPNTTYEYTMFLRKAGAGNRTAVGVQGLNTVRNN